jgi:hypothetical protein
MLGKNSYAPVLLGNGDLCALVDYRGAQFQNKELYERIKGTGLFFPMVCRAGRRYDTPDRALFTPGHFEDNSAEPESWEQTLDIGGAVSESCCRTKAGEISSMVLVHAARNIVAIRKRFTAGSRAGYTFKYFFSPGGTDSPPKRTVFKSSELPGGIELLYELDGRELYRGSIALLASVPAKCRAEGNVLFMEWTEAPRELDIFICYADSGFGADFPGESESLKKTVRKEGFDGLLASHTAEWRDFWSKSLLEFPDREILKTYRVAAYNLKCYSTRWSIPVGVFPSHWRGLYFGFTFFNPALCASGHMAEARRVPEFWRSVLDHAVMRTSHAQLSYPSAGARFSWLSDEFGEEGASPRFWIDHYLHMCSVSLETWTYYLYSSDAVFLEKTAYPILKNCADFFIIQAIYELKGGRVVVGRNTDLERLGPARENAFLTTCGAIAVLEWAADAADLLGVDGGLAVKWRTTAEKLRENLPHDGEKYLPYAGCEERSIAVTGGLYPYGVLPADDPKQLAALEDFRSFGIASAGNMLRAGKGLCAWYAAWLAAVMARLGRSGESLSFLNAAVGMTGYFNEIFEINEPGEHVSVPWCSSCPGTFFQAVHEMFLICRNDSIHISPAVPEGWGDYHFRLRAYDDLTVEVEVRNGKPAKLALTPGRLHSGREKCLVTPKSWPWRPPASVRLKGAPMEFNPA